MVAFNVEATTANESSQINYRFGGPFLVSSDEKLLDRMVIFVFVR